MNAGKIVVAIKPFIPYVVIGITLYLFFRKTGLIQSQSERKESEKEKKEAQQIEALNIWSTKTWATVPPTKLLTDKQAENLATHIRQSFGFFNDDEARIYGVFRSIVYQVQVSQIAYSYAKKYGRDLLSDLKDSLSNSEMGEIYKIIKSKPYG